MENKKLKETICAVVINDLGDILPYTCQPSKSQCEEFCADKWPHWPRLKEFGARVVQAKIVLLEE